jgi:hypothetical protein
MSAPFSAASADSTSDSNAPGCASPGNARPTLSAVESSPDTGPTSPATPTSENSVEPRSRPLTSSAADSHARTSASPARAQGSTENARVFGANTGVSLANFDLATSSWRTSQLSLLEDSGEFSGTWPRSGMTLNGVAYLLQPLALLTAATGSGLWPTPKVSGNRVGAASLKAGGHQGDGHWSAPGLEQAVEISLGIVPREVGSIDEIASPAARALWPTPTKSDAFKGYASPTSAPFSHGGSGGELHKQVAPSGGPLNPQWVAWLMGFPIDWTSLQPSETRSSRKSRSGSGVA